MSLPNIERAFIDQRKIVEYLLAFDHPEGTGKARFFYSFGFSVTDWQLLSDALLEHASHGSVTLASESFFGRKYQIDGMIVCPDGRTPTIRSIWIVDTGVDFARLVTAYPN